jgi:hypothetical protein
MSLEEYSLEEEIFIRINVTCEIDKLGDIVFTYKHIASS